MKPYICCLLLIFGMNSLAVSQDLPRRASWQTSFKALPQVGVKITKFRQNSALQAAGLQVGDVLLSVNGQPITNSHVWNDLTDALVAEIAYQITFKRGNQLLTQQVTFAPVAKETYANLDVEYGVIVSDYGIRQRTIVTKPKGKTGKLPAIFVVGGLSCASVESTPGRSSNFIRTLRDLVNQSGMLVMRLEKPGMGDSEGDCSQTDFNIELNGIETALKNLKAREDVNPDKIIVYGSSMGSALAPYLANKYNLNGVIADGTFYRSWFEHMLEIERRIKTMQGVSQRDINQQITQAYIPLYYAMLVQKQSYAEAITANPLLAKYNYHGTEHMYGRPMSYYHQVQDFNFAGEWAALKVPARIRWGTHDWIMSEADNDMIVAALVAAGNTDVELVKFPGLDHWSTIHQSAVDSFNFKPGKWDDRISGQIVEWAKELNQ